jgi:ABC-type multidrug transport system ATPase subunit
VVFLDEPTSGLDATAASVVVRTMRTISEAGRTVMATIHQPSIEIFAAFDALVLLKRGGRLIFFGALGEGCAGLIGYLESQPGVPTILDGYNPATWMLEVSGGEVMAEGGAVKDFADLYEVPPLNLKHREIT